MPESLSFGKSCEYRVVSELLSHNFDVYVPIVDDKGIDCIIRQQDGRHIDIQIKGRLPRWIFNVGKFEPRENYYFILIPPDKNMYVIDSKTISTWVDAYGKLSCTQAIKDTLLHKYQYKGGKDFNRLLHF